MKPTNLNFTSGVLLTSLPNVFFLERSEASLSRCPSQCEPGLGDLSKPPAPAYFWGVKLMFVGVVNFGHVQLLTFIILKNFESCSNPYFGHIALVM